jgi:iron complex outermembrane receptor protein
MRNLKLSVAGVFFGFTLLAGWSITANAQDQDEPSDSSGSALLEEVIVTARKREESSQDVPVSVAAFGAEQLQTLKIRNLENLSVGIPNVALDDIGTFRSTANFSIRGLGINSSIPSIDPTVGVFIDGVYMGQNVGIVLDMFDIQSIEVLRGPQGTLFGRNVTGGAILVYSKRPTEEFELSARAALDGNPNGDGGLNKYAMASISGPIGESFGFRVSAYMNKDDGWFVNLANGKDFGEAETTIFRPVLTWQASENVDMTLRWEHIESDGQGPASQTHTNGSGVPGFFANFDRDSFDFAIDGEGFADMENDLFTFETNWDVELGDGTITNIFGYKDYTATGESDIDAQPVWLFHATIWNDQEQYSNELRYNGSFDRLNLTTGIFWFSNEINYHERRNLLGVATGGVAPALTQDGGGNYWVDSLAFFTSIDYELTDAWSLNAGIRYTDEEKEADIASLVRNLGFGYDISDDRRIYGHWTRAHRSGGYNLRNTAIDTVNLGPGPFDEETVDTFELGYKSELAGRGFLNAAVFYTQIDDMQREVNLSDPISGVVQVIKNTADAEIFGFEVEGTFALTDNLILQGSVGWIDPSYKTVRFDLNGDGVIDKEDKNLGLPRAAEWTFNIGLTHQLDFSNGGALSSRVNYAYRDESFYTDNNLGYLLSQDILDLGVDYHTPGGHWILSIYGRNLLDSVKHGGDTQLPSILGPVPTGGTFSPLAKGQVLGFEVTFNY